MTRLRARAKSGMVRYQGVEVSVCREVRADWEVVTAVSRRGTREKVRFWVGVFG